MTSVLDMYCALFRNIPFKVLVGLSMLVQVIFCVVNSLLLLDQASPVHVGFQIAEGLACIGVIITLAMGKWSIPLLLYLACSIANFIYLQFISLPLIIHGANSMDLLVNKNCTTLEQLNDVIKSDLYIRLGKLAIWETASFVVAAVTWVLVQTEYSRVVRQKTGNGEGQNGEKSLADVKIFFEKMKLENALFYAIYFDLFYCFFSMVAAYFHADKSLLYMELIELFVCLSVFYAVYAKKSPDLLWLYLIFKVVDTAYIQLVEGPTSACKALILAEKDFDHTTSHINEQISMRSFTTLIFFAIGQNASLLMSSASWLIIFTVYRTLKDGQAAQSNNSSHLPCVNSVVSFNSRGKSMEGEENLCPSSSSASNNSSAKSSTADLMKAWGASTRDANHE